MSQIRLSLAMIPIESQRAKIINILALIKTFAHNQIKFFSFNLNVSLLKNVFKTYECILCMYYKCNVRKAIFFFLNLILVVGLS